MIGVCRVHELVLHDAKRREVEFCECCSEYMCVECEGSFLRIIAFFKAKGSAKEKIKKFYECMKMKVSEQDISKLLSV